MKNHVNAYQIQGVFRTLPNIYNGAICKNSNCFYQFIRKTLHLGCLTGFWIHRWNSHNFQDDNYYYKQRLKNWWSIVIDNHWQIVGHKAKWRISKRMFQGNKARQIFRKTNISHPLIRTLTDETCHEKPRSSFSVIKTYSLKYLIYWKMFCKWRSREIGT